MFSRREALSLGTAGVGALLFPSRVRASSGGELLVHSPPHNLGTPVEYFGRLITPNDVFFVRSHFGPPALDGRRVLRVAGMVDQPLSLTVDDVKKLPQSTVTAVLQCAGNGRALHEPHVPGVQWLHGAMGQASWTGARLSDVLECARIKSGGRHVHLRGADRVPRPTTPPFIRSIPIDRAMQKDTLVAWAMNGEPLSLEHGAPLRLVVPGWAGDHWMKWLVDVQVHAEEADAFFVQTAYRIPTEPVAPGASVPPEKTTPVTTMPVKSVIARPVDGAVVQRRAEVVGVAFSGLAPVAKVEVSGDGGKSWKVAKLDGEPGVGRWHVFRAELELTGGAQAIIARATDVNGAGQPRDAAWNPSGYNWNGWHVVNVTVQA